MPKIPKLLKLRILCSGIAGLVLVGVLAFVSYQPIPPKVGAGSQTAIHTNSKTQSYATAGQVQGANTQPTGQSNTGSSAVAVAPSGAQRQPINIIANDPPIDPPPPVLCHIYDACGAQPADEQQGIYGNITIGPITPVCRVDLACDGPYQATIIVSNNEGEVTRFTSAADGSFRVDLLPGVYTLTPTTTGRYPWASAQTVTVGWGLYTQVDIQFDSGIR